MAAVPLITWSGDVPLLGAPLRGLLQGVAHATGAALLRRTGEQFFMLDGGGGGGGAAAGSAAAAAPGAGQPADGEARPAFGVADSDQPLLYQVGLLVGPAAAGRSQGGPAVEDGTAGSRAGWNNPQGLARWTICRMSCPVATMCIPFVAHACLCASCHGAFSHPAHGSFATACRRLPPLACDR